MKNQFNRQRRHSNNRSARSVALQQITRFTNLDSSGPLGKLRGTPLQLAEKYQAGAKDAQTQGDVVLFQTCQQYADHYLRLQAIALENEQSSQKNRSEQKQEEAADSDQEEAKELPQNTTDLSVPVQEIQELSEDLTTTKGV